MDDLISRTDVEQTVEDNILCYTHSDRPIDQDPDTECHRAIRTALRMLRKDLRKLPSVQPEPRWIPCSERLPEEYGNYLITTYDGNVDIGTIDPNGKSVWSACDADGFYWMRNVIAWMPLPEPYRAKRRTDE